MYTVGQTFSETRDYLHNGEIVDRTESVEILDARIIPGMFRFGKNQPMYTVRRTVTVGNLSPVVTEGEATQRQMDQIAGAE